MNHKLSIIIPCYNCEKTLKQSFDSCFTQEFTIPFEIILVDDGSTDGTVQLIKRLQKEATSHTDSRADSRVDKNFAGVKFIAHEKNRGGGAARNTGIAAATGDLIYCLDSDNFFSPKSVMPMIQYLDEKGADGVAFYERRFFVGNNPKLYHSRFNTILDREIRLGDFYEKDNGALLDNFIFKKTAYTKTGGYPENHGFDTQEYELNFVYHGGKVYISPGSIFYHRHASADRSYFEREYEKGNFSKNYYLITEKIFDIYSETAEKAILNYDIFKRGSMDDNLLLMLQDLHTQGLLLKQAGAITKDENLKTFNLQYLPAKMASRHDEAVAALMKILKNGLIGPVIYYDILRCAVASTIAIEGPVEIETDRLIESMQKKEKRLFKAYLRIPIINSIARRLIRLKRAMSPLS